MIVIDDSLPKEVEFHVLNSCSEEDRAHNWLKASSGMLTHATLIYKNVKAISWT